MYHNIIVHADRVSDLLSLASYITNCVEPYESRMVSGRLELKYLDEKVCSRVLIMASGCIAADRQQFTFTDTADTLIFRSARAYFEMVDTAPLRAFIVGAITDIYVTRGSSIMPTITDMSGLQWLIGRFIEDRLMDCEDENEETIWEIFQQWYAGVRQL